VPSAGPGYERRIAADSWHGHVEDRVDAVPVELGQTFSRCFHLGVDVPLAEAGPAPLTWFGPDEDVFMHVNSTKIFGSSVAGCSGNDVHSMLLAIFVSLPVIAGAGGWSPARGAGGLPMPVPSAWERRVRVCEIPSGTRVSAWVDQERPAPMRWCLA
jgi:hypothetical protein